MQRYTTQVISTAAARQGTSREVSSFWIQAVDLFDAGHYELSVLAADLHLNTSVQSLVPAARSAARVRLNLHRYVDALPDGTRCEYGAHLARHAAILSAGERVTKSAALDSLETVELLLGRIANRGTPDN